MSNPNKGVRLTWEDGEYYYTRCLSCHAYVDYQVGCDCEACVGVEHPVGRCRGCGAPVTEEVSYVD